MPLIVGKISTVAKPRVSGKWGQRRLLPRSWGGVMWKVISCTKLG